MFSIQWKKETNKAIQAIFKQARVCLQGFRAMQAHLMGLSLTDAHLSVLHFIS